MLRHMRSRSLALGGCMILAATMLATVAQADTTTADVNSDGRPDTVRIASAGPGTPSTLVVELAGGPTLTASAGEGLPPARVLRVANVDGRRGAEIFVDTSHISTDDTITIFTYLDGQLVVAGHLLAFGGDYGIEFGFNCTRTGDVHAIVSHSFTLNGRRWSRSDTVYVWRNGRLARHGHMSTTVLRGIPPRSQTGVGC